MAMLMRWTHVVDASLGEVERKACSAANLLHVKHFLNIPESFLTLQRYVCAIMATQSVVSAASLLAAAAAKQNSITYRTDDLEYDLGIMTAVDSHPVEPTETAEELEAVLLRTATETAQLFVKRMFALPVEKTDLGPVALLPPRLTKLARTKPVPRPKPLTRWQKFALSKGIEKHKRSRLVWDEAANDWKPRHGYGREGSDMDWAIPVKPGDDPMEDPFEKRALQKKERVVRNQLAHVKNLQHSSGAAPAPAPTAMIVDGRSATGVSGNALVAPRVFEGVPKPPRSKAAAARAEKLLAGKRAGASATSLDADAAGKPLLVPAGIAREGADHAKPGKRPREVIGVKVERLRAAQTATASMGKFDAALPDEPARPRNPKKAKRMPVETTSTERVMQDDVLRRLLGGGDGPGAKGGKTATPKPAGVKPKAGKPAGGGRGSKGGKPPMGAKAGKAASAARKGGR